MEITLRDVLTGVGIVGVGLGNWHAMRERMTRVEERMKTLTDATATLGTYVRALEASRSDEREERAESRANMRAFCDRLEKVEVGMEDGFKSVREALTDIKATVGGARRNHDSV